MKRVLIVSPGFPPTSAADLHRVRMSLPHYRDFDWEPIVLSVDPRDYGGLTEPDLLQTVPPDISVVRTHALPASLTRWLGVGNPGLRALGHLYSAGARVISREAIDLVFFSTTMFPVTVLGRLWKARFGTPYVVDFQDPWKTDYRGHGRPRGVKAGLAAAMHAGLEPFALRRVDGVMAVSDAYTATLRRRYPWIVEDMCATIPFGGSAADFDVAAALAWTNPFFDRADGRVHGVAVGRGGRDMGVAAGMLCRAIASAGGHTLSAGGPGLEHRMRCWFIGTDYAAAGGRPTVAPVAAQAGVQKIVHESPARVPYLHGLRFLQDAHFTIILGSDDPAYSPSKVYPYLLAKRPFLAVMHQVSPVVPLLRQAGTGVVVTFQPGEDTSTAVERLAEGIERLLTSSPADTPAPANVTAAFSASELVRRQVAVFDGVLRRRSPEGVPCTG